MKLGLRIDDKAAVIYREKWGTLAFAFGMALVCIAFGLGFYNLMAPHAGPSHGLLTFLCAVFALAGVLFLVRLPGYVGKAVADDGILLVRVDASGITIMANLGAPVKHYAWTTVQEVVLAERLRTVESDETGFSWNALIVFLSPDAPPVPWMERAQAGVSDSGEGRRYVSSVFPLGKGTQVRAEMARFAPASMPVRLCRRVVFDRRKALDAFEDP